MGNTDQQKCQQIHEAAMKLLAEVGVKYKEPKAIEVLEAHGVRMEGDIAYWTEEQVLEWAGKAPEVFEMVASNPKYNITVGGDEVNPSTSYGSPIYAEQDGTRRPCTMQDYINFAKLFEANPDYKTNGGLLVQPSDIDTSVGQMAMYYATLTHSEKTRVIPAGKGEFVQACIDCETLLAGGIDEMRAHPRMITLVNVITPLQLDINMTNTLFNMGAAGQACVVASAAMAGTTTPVTLASTIVYTTAEVISTIALAQMANPGVPCVFGSVSTTADMRTAQIAIGAPENALCEKYVALMADFYHLPSRAGGAVTDSKIVDAQSGYESMMNLFVDYQYHVNFILHAAGILDGYAASSAAKVIQDFEILRYIKRYFEDIEVNDDTVPMALMAEVDHDGEFLTSEHTFEHMGDALVPTISSRGVVQDIPHQMDNQIQKQYDRLMAAYQQPEVDPAILAKAKEILIAAGAEAPLLDQLETM